MSTRSNLTEIVYWVAEFMEWCRAHPYSLQMVALGVTGIVTIRFIYELLARKRNQAMYWEVTLIVLFTHICRNLV